MASQTLLQAYTDKKTSTKKDSNPWCKTAKHPREDSEDSDGSGAGDDDNSSCGDAPKPPIPHPHTPLQRHKRPMRKLRLKRSLDEALFAWKDAALQRLSELCFGELRQYGYFNSATLDGFMAIIEESLVRSVKERPTYHRKR